MNCKYKIYIDKLIEGKLNEEKEQEVLAHAVDCEECSLRLKEIEQVDLVMKDGLTQYPFESRKLNIMREIEGRKHNMTVLSIVFKARKYIYGTAAVLVLIFSVLLAKPLIDNHRYAYKEGYINNPGNAGDNPVNKTSSNLNSNALQELEKEMNSIIKESLDMQYGLNSSENTEILSPKFIDKISSNPNLYYKKELKPYNIVDIKYSVAYDDSSDPNIAFVRVIDSKGSAFVEVVHFIKVGNKLVIDDIEYDI